MSGQRRNDDPASDQAHALLALYLAQGRPGASAATVDTGAPVNDGELAQLAEGRLPAGRRQQVMRQLVDQPATRQRWLNLMEATQGLAPQQAGARTPRPTAWRPWQWLGGGLALAGAFALGVVVAPLAPFTPRTPPAPTALAAEAQALEPGGIHHSPQRASTARIHPDPDTGCLPLAHPHTAAPGLLCPQASADDRNAVRWTWQPQAP